MAIVVNTEKGERIIGSYKVINPDKKLGPSLFHVLNTGVILDTSKRGVELNLGWNDIVSTIPKKGKKEILVLTFRVDGTLYHYEMQFYDANLVNNDITKGHTEAVKAYNANPKTPTEPSMEEKSKVGKEYFDAYKGYLKARQDYVKNPNPLLLKDTKYQAFLSKNYAPPMEDNQEIVNEINNHDLNTISISKNGFIFTKNVKVKNGDFKHKESNTSAIRRKDGEVDIIISDNDDGFSYDEQGIRKRHVVFHKTQVPEKYHNLIIPDKTTGEKIKTSYAPGDDDEHYPNIPKKYKWGRIWYDEKSDEFIDNNDNNKKIDKNNLYFYHGLPCYKHNNRIHTLIPMHISMLTYKMAKSKENNEWHYDVITERLTDETDDIKNLNFESELPIGIFGHASNSKFNAFENKRWTFCELILLNKKFAAFLLNDHVRYALRDSEYMLPSCTRTIDELILGMNLVYQNIKYDENLDWEMLQLAMNNSLIDCIKEIFKDQPEFKKMLTVPTYIFAGGKYIVPKFKVEPKYENTSATIGMNGMFGNIDGTKFDKLQETNEDRYAYFMCGAYTGARIFSYLSPRSFNIKSAFVLKDYPLVPCVYDDKLMEKIDSVRENKILELKEKDKEFAEYKKSDRHQIVNERIALSPVKIIIEAHKAALKIIKTERKPITKEEYLAKKFGNYTLQILPDKYYTAKIKDWVLKFEKNEYFPNNGVMPVITYMVDMIYPGFVTNHIYPHYNTIDDIGLEITETLKDQNVPKELGPCRGYYDRDAFGTYCGMGTSPEEHEKLKKYFEEEQRKFYA